MLSMASLPYSVMRFIGVPVELGTMIIFAPASIQPDCLCLSANLSLIRLTDFDSPSKIYGSLSMALLKILMPVVEVYLMGTAALACLGVRVNRMTVGMFGTVLTTPPPTPPGPVPTPHPLGVVPAEVYE